jgi:hypothetical protein
MMLVPCPVTKNVDNRLLMLIAHLSNGTSSRTPIYIVYMRTSRSIGPSLCGEVRRIPIPRTPVNSVR